MSSFDEILEKKPDDDGDEIIEKEEDDETKLKNIQEYLKILKDAFEGEYDSNFENKLKGFFKYTMGRDMNFEEEYELLKVLKVDEGELTLSERRSLFDLENNPVYIRDQFEITPETRFAQIVNYVKSMLDLFSEFIGQTFKKFLDSNPFKDDLSEDIKEFDSNPVDGADKEEVVEIEEQMKPLTEKNFSASIINKLNEILNVIASYFARILNPIEKFITTFLREFKYADMADIGNEIDSTTNKIDKLNDDIEKFQSTVNTLPPGVDEDVLEEGETYRLKKIEKEKLTNRLSKIQPQYNDFIDSLDDKEEFEEYKKMAGEKGETLIGRYLSGSTRIKINAILRPIDDLLGLIIDSIIDPVNDFFTTVFRKFKYADMADIGNEIDSTTNKIDKLNDDIEKFQSTVNTLPPGVDEDVLEEGETYRLKKIEKEKLTNRLSKIQPQYNDFINSLDKEELENFKLYKEAAKSKGDSLIGQYLSGSTRIKINAILDPINELFERISMNINELFERISMNINKLILSFEKEINIRLGTPQGIAYLEHDIFETEGEIKELELAEQNELTDTKINKLRSKLKILKSNLEKIPQSEEELTAIIDKKLNLLNKDIDEKALYLADRKLADRSFFDQKFELSKKAIIRSLKEYVSVAAKLDKVPSDIKWADEVDEGDKILAYTIERDNKLNPDIFSDGDVKENYFQIPKKVDKDDEFKDGDNVSEGDDSFQSFLDLNEFEESDEYFSPFEGDDSFQKFLDLNEFKESDEYFSPFEGDDVKEDDEFKDDNVSEDVQPKGNLSKVSEYLSKVQKINEVFIKIEMLGLRTGSQLAKLAFYNRTEEGLEAFEQFMGRGMTNADYLTLYNREMPLKLAVKSGSNLAKVAFTSPTVEGLNAFKQIMGRAMTNNDFLYLYDKDMPENLQNL